MRSAPIHDISALKKNDKVFVKSKEVTQFDTIVYVVLRMLPSSKGYVEFKAKYTMV